MSNLRDFHDAVCPICKNLDPALIYDIEIQGAYDGALILHCVICGHNWPRFTPSNHLHQRALDVIAQWETQ